MRKFFEKSATTQMATLNVLVSGKSIPSGTSRKLTLIISPKLSSEYKREKMELGYEARRFSTVSNEPL